MQPLKTKANHFNDIEINPGCEINNFVTGLTKMTFLCGNDIKFSEGGFAPLKIFTIEILNFKG